MPTMKALCMDVITSADYHREQSIPQIALSRLDFPQPDVPTISKDSPRFSSRSNPCMSTGNEQCMRGLAFSFSYTLKTFCLWVWEIQQKSKLDAKHKMAKHT